MLLKYSFVLSLLFITRITNVFSQGIIGDWNGKLKTGTIQLRVVFHINKSGEVYNGTLDSPDQGAKGIPLSSVRYEKDTLHLELQGAQIKYAGYLKSDSEIIGTFQQGPQSFPLNLTRQAKGAEVLSRPQEPKKPYPYNSEEIRFTNDRDHIELAGTLTEPGKDGNFPAVVLITGSGPQNRDEELMGHKPFLVISDYLTRHGIAVLRFDDRGTAESTGDFKTATSLDFSYDAEAAVKYLKTRKEINKNKIGLIGHSEGGLIAPMIAARSKSVAFIVLLAGPGLRGDTLLLLQQKLILSLSGTPDSILQKQFEINRGAFKIILHEKDSARLSLALQKYIRKSLEENKGSIPPDVSENDFVNSQVHPLTSPWMRYFLVYDPVPTLKTVNCPILALGGEKDLQVPALINLKLIQEAAAGSGNKAVTIEELPGLNHLFQHAETGSPAEYGQIEETFSPEALKIIADWVLVH